jgi:hypothetical protein
MQLDYQKGKKGRSKIVTIDGVEYTKTSLMEAVRGFFAHAESKNNLVVLGHFREIAKALSPVYQGWDNECIPAEDVLMVTLVFDRYTDPRKKAAAHFKLVLCNSETNYIVGFHAGITVLFDGLAKLKESRAKDAFRWEVSNQSRYYLQETIKLHPKLQAKFEADNYSVHVDHVEPFSVLLKKFLSQENISLTDIETNYRETGTYYARTLVDRGLRNRWVKFHLENANFQLLSREDNIRKGDKPTLGVL